MSGDRLGYVQSFQSLVVYQRAGTVCRKIFALTKSFPKDETYSLTDQVRRASRSVGAQIAEGWAKRRYEKHFVSKLTDALAEQHETHHWITVAAECGYIGKQDEEEVLSELAQVGRMLHSMIDKSSSFCGTKSERVRESIAEYYCSDT